MAHHHLFFVPCVYFELLFILYVFRSVYNCKVWNILNSYKKFEEKRHIINSLWNAMKLSPFWLFGLLEKKWDDDSKLFHFNQCNAGPSLEWVMGAWHQWNFEILYKRNYENRSLVSPLLCSGTHALELLTRTL